MRIHRLVITAILGISILSASVSAFAFQRNEDRNRGGGGGQNRGGGGQSRPAPVEHAQRERVRTPNYVPRQTGGGAPRPEPGGQPNRPPTAIRRPIVPNAPAIRAQRQFTRTAAGRVYDNGLRLRKGVTVTLAWERPYFPKGHAHFPFYRETFVRGQSFRSPFGFYFGVCVPYIAASECHVYPPAVVFIDIPVYNGVECTGFSDADDQNLFDDPNLDQDHPGLRNAIDDLTEAFQGGDIDGLVTLIDPNTSVAIYLNGHYQYSLAANDYIDLARDAIQSMNNVAFTLNYLHQRSPNVYSVAGKQTYRDQNGQIQTTWVSFVLQDISGQWTLTQAGTSPGRKHKP